MVVKKIKKSFVKKSIVFFIIFTFLFSIMPATILTIKVEANPGNENSNPIVNMSDGTWIDRFENTNGIEKLETLILDPASHSIKIDTGTYSILYDFSSKYFSSGSAAFKRERVVASPPSYFSEGELGSIITGLGLRKSWFEYEFSEEEYNNISYVDNKYTLTEGKKLCHAVQHFLFKVNEPRRNIESVFVEWQGYGENSRGKVYCWNYSSKRFDRIGEYEATSKNSELMKVFSIEDIINHVDTSGYIHIVIETDETTKFFGETVGIYTNYIGLLTEGTKYVKEGYLQSKEIHVDRANISRWGYFVWNDYTPLDSKIVYRVYKPVEKGVVGAIEPIDDKYLPGNSKGFTTPPVDLSGIPVNYTDKLILCANFSASSNGIFTPKLYDWGVTWQKMENSWIDKFSTSYRVFSSNNIDIENGNVTISELSIDWPTFGKSLSNQRIAEGYGANTNNLVWRTGTGVGGIFCSPVIKDGIIYIASPDGSVSARDTLNGGIGGIIYWKTTGLGAFTSSPAVTEDLVIVGSCKSGEVNKVYALDRASGNITWDYQYDQSTPFCYYSPPVVHNEKVYVTAVREKQSILDFSKPIYKLLALSKQDGRLLWEFDLPAAVYAPPAIDNGVLFIGCANENGSSLFAIDEDTGGAIWENDLIGPMGRAAPVVYNGNIYVVTIENKTTGTPSVASVALYAINKTDGTIVNSTYLGEINTQDLLNSINSIIQSTLGLDLGKLIHPISSNAVASSTPTVYNGIVFVGSPDGTIHAFDAETLEEIYPPIETSENYLFSSPAIVQNTLYIASCGNIQTGLIMNGGKIYAISLDTWSEKWHYDAMLDATITSSPIISNGILYVCDDEGRLYAIGEYKKGYNLEGTFISNLIKVPTGKWWDKFYYQLQGSGTCTVSILDENFNPITGFINIGNGENLSALPANKIHISAKISRSSEVQNPTIKYYKLTWRAETDYPGGWKDLFPEGWWNKEEANCSINVRDPTSGLDVTSAKYRVNYTIDILTPSNLTNEKINSLNATDILGELYIKDYLLISLTEYWITALYGYTSWEKAYCTGTNGTKDFQTIIAFDVPVTANTLRNILPIDVLEEYLGPYNVNFSISVNGVQFQISDLAGNINNSKTYSIQIDTQAPTSNIIFQLDPFETYNGYDWYGVNNISLVIDAQDDKSGLSEVWLYYNYSEDGMNWTGWLPYENITPPFATSFTTIDEGFYKLCSIAIDNAGNYEDPHEKDAEGNVSLIAIDLKKPEAHYDPEVEHWYNETPPTITINFTDNMLLKEIKYQLSGRNFTGEWTTIATDIGRKFYNESFQINKEKWDEIDAGYTYYLTFKVIDYAGNEYTTSDNARFRIGKDLDKPRSMPKKFKVKWHSSLPVKITATAVEDTSSIYNVTLYYRYSPNNKTGTWTEWKAYGEGKYLGNYTWEWDFNAPDGNGYYQFYTIATDVAGNAEYKESYEVTTGVNALPIVPIIAAIILFIISLLVLIILKFKVLKK
jgi:outer membrane protein assembly factor BamB